MVPITGFLTALPFLALIVFGLYVLPYYVERGVDEFTVYRKDDRRAALSGFLLETGPSVVCVLLGVGATWFVVSNFGSTPVHVKTMIRVVAGTLFIAALAATLFVLKLKRLAAYSALELLFGCVVGAQTMYTLEDSVSPGQIAGVLAAAYLMVRGLDNARKAAAEAKEAWRSRVTGEENGGVFG